MIDALRRRADTHTPAPNRLDVPADEQRSSSFLGLPPTYRGFGLPNSMHHPTKGLLTCFFWCGHTAEGINEEREEEDAENLSVGMPDVSWVGVVDRRL